MKSLLILTLATLTITSTFSQAWTKEKGKSFLKLDFTTITGNKVFNDKSEVVDFRSFSFNTASLYAEYGISNKLTTVVYMPFMQSNTLKASTLSPDASNVGFGDVDIAIRYAISKEKFPLTATLLLGIPTGEFVEPNELFTGDGEFNQMLKIASGAGADKWWVQGGVGFNNRTENFSDEIRFDAEFGYKFLNKKLMTMFKIGGISPLDNGKAATTKTGLFSNNVAYVSPAIELMYFVKPNLGFTFRGAGAGAGTRNVQATPSFSIGVFMGQ